MEPLSGQRAAARARYVLRPKLRRSRSEFKRAKKPVASQERPSTLWVSCRSVGWTNLAGLAQDVGLGVSDGLVGEEGEVVTDGLGVDEAHGFLVAGLAEEALAGPEHDRVDHQPQLVDEVVL